MAADWRRSGVAELTGRPDGPALAPVGAPATLSRALCLAIEAIGGPRLPGGADPEPPGGTVLGTRVGAIPLRRGGDVSAGGAARILRARDGWLALSLPRAADLELVAALCETTPVTGDPWDVVGAWVGSRSASAATERAALLGLAVSRLGEWRESECRESDCRESDCHGSDCHGSKWPWRLLAQPAPSGPTPDARARARPRVVNLGALWAAPLCAQILSRAGWEVLDVSDPRRADSTPSALRSLLAHDGAHLQIDFRAPEGRERLRDLLASADVVIEASRPRALRQLGLDAETVMADGRRRTWLRITGHGADSERIAFGDDAAVAGGLVAWDADGPVFAGDAIADPLTGLSAALLALATTPSAPESARPAPGWIIDVPMAGVAALAAGL